MKPRQGRSIALLLRNIGIGTSLVYGHVRLSDSLNEDDTADTGIAPSVTAVYGAVQELDEQISKANTALEDKADVDHTHTNIISSGVKTFTKSSITPSSTIDEIPFDGITITESYNDSNAPTTYANVINVRGKQYTGGGQLVLGWSGKDSTTAEIFYRSHRNTSTGGWGNFRKIFFEDSSNISGPLTIAGQTTVNNNLSLSGNIVGTGTDKTIEGFAVYGAVWNDYAELFPRGEETEVGDIVALDMTSGEEKYVKATFDSSVVVGVHSNSFGHLIGGEQPQNGENFLEYNLPKYIPVALCGRVPVKVKGEVKVGDWIVPSQEAGVGEAFDADIHDFKRTVGVVVSIINENLVKILIKK